MILTLILIGVSFGFKTQPSKFSFTDKYGNELTIQNIELIPELIDTEFLKNNLNGRQFTFKRKEDAKLKFEYTISEFLRIDQMEYRLQILQKPKSGKQVDLTKNIGFSYYRMKLKQTKSGVELVKVEFMYAEL